MKTRYILLLSTIISISLLFADHYGKLNNNNFVRISVLLNHISGIITHFFNTIGVYIAYISSYITNIDFRELYISYTDVKNAAKSIFSFNSFWLGFNNKMVEYGDYYNKLKEVDLELAKINIILHFTGLLLIMYVTPICIFYRFPIFTVTLILVYCSCTLSIIPFYLGIVLYYIVFGYIDNKKKVLEFFADFVTTKVN
jgi:hypothetical protein